VKITHSTTPGWQTLWAQIDRRMARLRRWYDPAQPRLGNNGDLEDEVDALLTCLNHLADWLKWDDVHLPDITKKIVDGYVRNNKPLTICRDYANSFKHHTRSTKYDTDPGYARHFETDSDNLKASIRYWSKAQVETSVDSLDLAEQCYAAWLQFFTQEGIPLPY
jgi:hypothetical protein